MERRLEGKRVLVTRPRERAETLCYLLEDEGADVLAVPVLELLPPEDERPLAAAAETLHRYRWVVFASPSGVEALVDALRQAGTLAHLGRVKVAAVGPGTRARLEALGVKVLAEPPEGTGRALLEAMQGELEPGDEVLLPAAEQGRVELAEGLAEAGARVTRVVAYRSAPVAIEPEALAALDARAPDVALFASPRTAEAFLAAAGRERLGAARLVAIGPTTAAGLASLGLPVAAVAERPTPEALVEAAVQAAQRVG